MKIEYFMFLLLCGLLIVLFNEWENVEAHVPVFLFLYTLEFHHFYIKLYA